MARSNDTQHFFANLSDEHNTSQPAQDTPGTKRSYDIPDSYNIWVTTLSELATKRGITLWKVPYSTGYTTLYERMQSYPDDWGVEEFTPPAGKLGAAGFYWEAWQAKTVCLNCGGIIKEFHRDEDPWIWHAIHYPQCSYLLLVKGHEFVDGLQEERSRSAKDTSHTLEQMQH